MLSDVCVKKINDYIEDNYNKDISLVQLADYIGFSSYYLSKLIKERMDTNYIKYLTEVRIEKAKELLADGDLNISEIAYEVGYSEPKYFSNVFKKSEGMTPTEYKRGVSKVRDHAAL